MDRIAYETFARLENDHFWFVGRRRIFGEMLDRIVGSRTDLAILEIGCGTGGLLSTLEAHGRVHGCDIDFESMRFCRERGFERMLVGSGYELPYLDESFDLVGMFDTIEHIPDEHRALSEAHRVLKPGGTLFLSVPAYQFLWSQNDRVAHHCRRYTAMRLKKVVRAAGFRPLKTSYFNTLLFPLIVPAIFWQKVRDRLGLLPEGYNNTSVPLSRPLNALLCAVMSSERHLLSRMSFPFGHSLISLSRK
ncbi:MAG: class I SAM-dependent methyltransferase [Planctomycetota bacterium]